MFDLEQNILQWRKSLSVKELCDADIDELESHLREQIDDLKLKELSDEESFWIARKRIGDSEALGKEFEKVNYHAMMKKRIMWALGGILIFTVINMLYSFLYQIYTVSPLLTGWKPETIFYIVLSINMGLTIGICYGIYKFIFKDNNRIEKFFVKTVFFSKKKTNKKILIYSSVSFLLLYLGNSIAYQYFISPYINSHAYRFGAVPFYKYLASYQIIWFGLIVCFLFYLFFKLYDEQHEIKYAKN